ncbi:MAG: putative transrane protein [Caulobacter sp.]|nr:putative transrane protein [Caulobacter sp.]
MGSEAPRPRRRAAIGRLAAACVLGLALPPSAWAGDAAAEYAIKAAYLAKFALFVEWPGDAAPAAGAPLQICVLGPDPFGPSLARTAGEARPIVVRRLTSAAATAGCHVLYLAEPSSRAVAEALRAVRGAPVLTVTDGARQQAVRGVIHFEIRDNRVRFHIDDQAAGEDRLIISSRLLALALSVRRRGE